MTGLTDTQVVTASGGLVELGYSQITSSVSVVSTTPATGTEVIPPLTVVCDGSPVIVEFFASLAHPHNTAGDAMAFRLAMDGASVHTSWGYQSTPASGFVAQPVLLSYRTTPSAGSHTFGVSASVTNASRPGTISASNTSTNVAPAFLRVSKIVQATQWPAVTTGTIICTSTTRPASPFEGQTIYQTDDNKEFIWDGAAWYSPGLQVVASKTATQTGVGGSFTDVTSLSATWTAVSSRYYKTTVYFPKLVQNTSSGYAQFQITDASNTTKQSSVEYPPSGDYFTSSMFLLETGLSGSVTRKVRATTSAGTLDIYGGSTQPTYIIVEDIGPA